MIYLAAPYTHQDPAVVDRRLETFFKYDLYLTSEGFHTVSPLYKTLIALKVPDVQLDYGTWEDYCRALMKLCSEVHVLTLEGWQESEGVLDEIHMAYEFTLPIVYVDVDDI